MTTSPRGDGAVFARTDVLLDLWGARHLDDAEYTERAMRRAAGVSGAILLHIHLYRFGDGEGTGVAMLAELLRTERRLVTRNRVTFPYGAFMNSSSASNPPYS